MIPSDNLPLINLILTFEITSIAVFTRQEDFFIFYDHIFHFLRAVPFPQNSVLDIS